MAQLNVDTIKNSAGTGGPAISGSTTGSAPAAGVIGEKIGVTLSANTAHVQNTEIDVTGASITLTAGNWHITYNLNWKGQNLFGIGDVGTGNTRFTVTDSSNNIIAGSTFFHSVTWAASGVTEYYTAYKTLVVNISSSTTYKVRFINSRNTGTQGLHTVLGVDEGIYTGADFESTFYAVRIG